MSHADGVFTLARLVAVEFGIGKACAVRGAFLEVASGVMPTVLRIGATRFFFYRNEGGEPAHIHVEQAGALAEFWLDPVTLAASSRFSGHELRRLEKQVMEHRQRFVEAWREHFGT